MAIQAAAPRSEFVVDRTWETNQRSPLRWILSHLGRNPGVIIVMLIGAVGNALLASAIPLFTGRAFDVVSDNPATLRPLLLIALALVASQLLRGGIQLMRNFGSELLGQRLERDAREELYSSLLGKSMTFHDLRPTGEVMARATNDVRELALMMAPGVNLVLGSGAFLFMPFFLAPAIHPQLIAVPILFALSYLVSIVFYLRALRPATEGVRRTFGEMNAELTAAIEGIETVKGAAQEEAEASRFAAGARAVHDALVRQGLIEARFLPLLLLGIAQALAFTHALLLYRQGQLSVGDVVAYMGLVGLFGFPVFTSLFAYSQMSSGVASARRILELIKSETELDRNEAGFAGPPRGAIRFEGVTFRYSISERESPTEAASDLPPATRPSLEEVSFEVVAGQTLALVGQTGSGKSTVTKLLNRTYDVEEGRVLVDGVDVRAWNLEALRRGISIIEQDVFLFSRSIADNIAFGKPDASQEEIENAARAAQAHDFIQGFPEGYQTLVGERGVTLSGGQRQRIALARAFLTDPAILILDDSTSAIDSATEDQIQRAIEHATRGRTTILITHRLSQIRWADKIVVLRKGRVAAVGSHEELMEQSQAYRDIFARF
jgi:ATP-binding cassette subfamily B protein